MRKFGFRLIIAATVAVTILCVIILATHDVSDEGDRQRCRHRGGVIVEDRNGYFKECHLK